MRVIFLTYLEGEALQRLNEVLRHPVIARTLDDLRVIDENGLGDAVLLSYGTSVIVPPELLNRYHAAYNLHAASPEYPGRDPHHWAIYEGAKRYGATMHVMTDKVDDGPIVDVEWFDVPSGITPTELLAKANEASMKILLRTGKAIALGEKPAPIPIEWSGIKRKRSDFMAICRLPSNISREEFMRRYHAFDGSKYNNLTVELHGKTFRIDKTLCG